MQTKNLQLDNFNKKKKSILITKYLKKILYEKNHVIESLQNSYKDKVSTALNTFHLANSYLNNLLNIQQSYIKEDYERLRLGSNFEKVVKNVDMLFNIRKKFYPNSITEIRISGIDNEKNLYKILP